MGKIINFLKNLLLTIVYPDRLLTVFRVRNLDQNSNKILGNDKIVKIIALVGAIAFVGVIRYTPAPSRTFQETISNVTLVRYIDDEHYTYFGSQIPQNVEIILTGARTDITLLLASGEIGAYIDLTGLEQGQHENVLIGLRGIPSNITATVVPNIIPRVEIDYLVTEIFEISATLRPPEIEPNSKYAISEMIIYPENVAVTGPLRFVGIIHELVVSFDMSDVTIEPGIFQLGGQLVAQDINFNNVGGITFSTAHISAEVEIYEDTQTVSIEVLRPTNLGNHSILEIITNVDSIEVWGDFTRFQSIITLPRFNLSDLDENGQTTFTISLPEGLYSDVSEVEVTVIYEEIIPVVIDDVDY